MTMKFSFRHFPSRKRTAKLTRHEERVVAEAGELARLRLEQRIADLHIWLPPTNDTLRRPSDRGVLA